MLKSGSKLLFLLAITLLSATAQAEEWLLVATPGVRNYLEYGGHGLLVFDVEHGHKFVKRIPLGGLDAAGKPSNVKGLCGNAKTGRIYISTLKTLQCLDFASEKLLWEKEYPGGCDRMSITPDGSKIYLPSLEGPHWHVVGADGEILAKIEPNSGAHNTIVSLDGSQAYLAGLKSPFLEIVDVSTNNKIVHRVGPFAASIRPFTVDANRQRCIVCINELLGFEVGDMVAGTKLARVEVSGYKQGPVKRHGCPSHGVALSPDEKEIWVVDAFNQSLHLFDATVMPPKQLESIKLADEPGWITFSPDGKYAYPSTGQVIEARTRKILLQLTDETGAKVQSEKMLPVTVTDGKLRAVGDQFGLGRGHRL